MQNLLTIRLSDFDLPNVTLAEDEYQLREAVRAILLDAHDEIYLMHVTKYGYHKLPGGGIDAGESRQEALARELMEEVGCAAITENEVGQIVEYRHFYGHEKQVSYCYIARQNGEQHESHLEDDELEEGMIQIKAKNLQEAIALLENDMPDDLEGKYIRKRDLAFLRAAAQII